MFAANVQDPDVFYYRGITNARLGNRGAATADLEKAGSLYLTNNEATRYRLVLDALDKL